MARDSIEVLKPTSMNKGISGIRVKEEEEEKNATGGQERMRQGATTLHSKVGERIKSGFVFYFSIFIFLLLTIINYPDVHYY